MVDHTAKFSDAVFAWEHWNLTDFDSKSVCLLAFKDLVAQIQPQRAEVIRFHIEQAALIGLTHQLLG